MKIMLVGGGSGGHITPLLAVARELKKHSSTVKLIYAGEKNGGFINVVSGSGLFDDVCLVRAGKFRRYPNQPIYVRVFDIKTHLLNMRDIIYTIFGFFQSLRCLRKNRPNVIFIKGGFVGVPLGLAAKLLGIAYITHDSDTVPGLANRIIGRWAILHCTGMPETFYNYPENSIKYTGIPLSDEYTRVTDKLKLAYRSKLGYGMGNFLIMVTGGSQGANRLNKLMSLIARELFDEIPGLEIIHQTGRNGAEVYSDLEEGYKKRIRTKEYFADMHIYSGAADIVVTRAGASTMSELAIQNKPCIVIASPFLAGGHQLKNAQYYKENNAAIVVNEDDALSRPQVLLRAVLNLANDKNQQLKLASKLGSLGKNDAAESIAKLLLKEVEK
jgi:UDP-N-acetylglucosamine--N-acetylmuramyl-(pentapeptide) pyrophosphoryl-undecaprenol N-acetylglucosamine transferase